MIRNFFLCLLALILIFNQTNAQINRFERDLSIPATVLGNALKLPWAGGLNTPIFSEIDLNKDGIQDLFIFDKDGFRVTTYINNGTPGQFDYEYAPEYISKFPYLHDWALLVDYDCDSNPDIFTYSTEGGIKVFHNDYTAQNGLSFSLVDSSLNSQYSLFFNSNLFVASVNIPAIKDIDGDGDIDILTISNTGSFVEFHRNAAMENLGTCGLDSFFIDPVMGWGHFGLSPFSNTALLNYIKPAPPVFDGDDQDVHPGYYLDKSKQSAHSGSCLLAVNWDGDSLVDLVNGDILGNNLLYLQNGGTPDSALMVSYDSLFPSYNDAVNLVTFPHAHYFDVDNDGARDLVVSPCMANNTENVDNVWFYKNFGTTDSSSFVHLKNTLFTEEMIDLGSASNISFFDADGDGLQDILAGNFGYFSPFGFYSSRLAYFRNTGTVSNPAYALITSDYANLGNYYLSAINTCFGDLDGDNDDDMLIGVEDGTLIYFKNNPAGSVADFAFDSPNYQNIDVGNYNAPQLVDVNQDGKKDLLIGCQAGKLFYYENTGTLSNPVFTLITDSFGGVNVVQYPNNTNNGFSTPVLIDTAGIQRLLVGSARGTIFLYDSITGNLNGQFNLVDSMYGKIYEAARITIGVNDINNDGLFDILTGNLDGGMTFYKHLPDSLTGLEQAGNNDMQFGAYPNPADESLRIFVSGSEGGNNRVKLFNSSGNLLYETAFSGNRCEVNISSWVNGIYFLQVTNERKAVAYKKLVIHHSSQGNN